MQYFCIYWTLNSLFQLADNSEYDKLWEGSTAKTASRIASRRKFNIDSFVFHKVLGKGSFGKVCNKLTELKVTAFLDLCNVMGYFYYLYYFYSINQKRLTAAWVENLLTELNIAIFVKDTRNSWPESCLNSKVIQNAQQFFSYLVSRQRNCPLCTTVQKDILRLYTLYRNSLIMLQCSSRGRCWESSMSAVFCETTALMKEQALRAFCLYTHKTLTEKLPWKPLCLCYMVLKTHLLISMPSNFTLPNLTHVSHLNVFLIVIASAINTFDFPFDWSHQQQSFLHVL